MTIDRSKIFQSFKNGLYQVYVKDKFHQGDRFAIVDENFNPVVDEIFSGCVDLKEDGIEVYKYQQKNWVYLKSEKVLTGTLKPQMKFEKKPLQNAGKSLH